MKLSQVLRFIAGLVSGALVGGAVVILLAPRSGAETRQGITDKVHEIVNAGKQAMADRRQQLRGEYESAIRIPLPAAQAKSN